MSNDVLHQLHVGRIIDFLAKNRIAGMFQSKDNVTAGGLMAYGASLPDLFRRAAAYVHVSCRAPSSPTCQSSCQPSSIWQSTSRLRARLGLELPPLLVARADEVALLNPKFATALAARCLRTTGWGTRMAIRVPRCAAVERPELPMEP